MICKKTMLPVKLDNPTEPTRTRPKNNYCKYAWYRTMIPLCSFRHINVLNRALRLNIRFRIKNHRNITIKIGYTSAHSPEMWIIWYIQTNMLICVPWQHILVHLGIHTMQYILIKGDITSNSTCGRGVVNVDGLIEIITFSIVKHLPDARIFCACYRVRMCMFYLAHAAP